MEKGLTELISAPGIDNLSISVSPKVGCHAIRVWLWELATGERIEGWNVFRKFEASGLCKSIASQRCPNELRIAVHRDGPDRLRAVYDHRVLRMHEWHDCTLDEFAWNLADASIQSFWIKHHLRPQWHWLGGDPREFDIIIPFSRLSILPEIVSAHLKRDVPGLPHTHKTSSPTPISEEAAELLGYWSAYDTAIGWDGINEKGI